MDLGFNVMEAMIARSRKYSLIMVSSSSIWNSIKSNGKSNVVTLDFIDASCKVRYHEKAKRIIVIVLARFDLEEVKNIIKKHYDYWNELTSENLDFFWLGYDTDFMTAESRDADKDTIIKHILFNNRSYIRDVKRLKKLTGIDIKDEIGLLLLDVDNGSVKYEKRLYLRIERLIHKEADTNLKTFFSYLIIACSGNACIEEVRKKLKIMHFVLSTKELSISDILDVAVSLKGIMLKKD